MPDDRLLLGSVGSSQTLHELDILHSALEQSGVLVWTARADGFVDYVSESFERFCGLLRSEVIGLGCRVLMPESEHEAGSERWRRATALGEGYQAGVTFRNEQGDLVPHSIRLRPLGSESGVVSRWLGTARRVTGHQASNESRFKRLASPLSGECVGAAACGPAGDPRSWWHVQEPDGTPYVASAEWLTSAAERAPTEIDRKQVLWAAQYYAARGTPLAIVAPMDAEPYETRGPILPTVPWLLGR